MITIHVEPVGFRKGRYVSKFKAYLGDRLLCESNSPLLASARVLLAEGVPPETSIQMIHKGSSVVSMTGTVGKASKLAVAENEIEGPRFAKYRELSPQTIASFRSPISHTAISGLPDASEGLRQESLPEHAFADDYARS